MNIDLTTTYLGLPLKNPLVASASPLPHTLEGVRAPEDVLKAMFAGANATILASELLQSEVGHAAEILGDMARWMEGHDQCSITRMHGLSRQFFAVEPAAFEWVSCTKAILSFDPAHSRREALV